MKPQTIRRVKKHFVNAFELLIPKKLVQMKGFDLKYDDYNTGPTVKESLTIHKEIILCYNNQPENFKWISMMLRFRDHGYRLLPGSFDQFYLTDPSIIDQYVHFFSAPLPRDIAEWRKQLSTTPDTEDLLLLDGHGPIPDTCITGGDMVEWGLKEMVEDTGPEQSPSSMMAYVRLG